MVQIVAFLGRGNVKLTRNPVIANSKVIRNAFSITLRKCQTILRAICRVATHLRRRLPYNLCHVSPRRVCVNVWFFAIVGICVSLRVVEAFGNQSAHFCGGIPSSCTLAITIFGWTINCSAKSTNVSKVTESQGVGDKLGCTYKFKSKMHVVVICRAISARLASHSRAGDEWF